MKKSGTLSKLISLLMIIFSGCAIIRHTPKTYSEKDLCYILTKNRLISDNAVIKYRISGKGLSFSGKATLQKNDSFLLISTYNFFTGKKTLKISIGNSGYALLDFAGLYVFGENPLKKFRFTGMKDRNILSFTKKSDTLNVVIKDNRVISIAERNDNVLLFYDSRGKLTLTRGKFQGFFFEGAVIK